MMGLGCSYGVALWGGPTGWGPYGVEFLWGGPIWVGCLGSGPMGGGPMGWPYWVRVLTGWSSYSVTLYGGGTAEWPYGVALLGGVAMGR